MQKERNAREKHVSTALGIALVEGRKPSAKATSLAQQYIEGKLTVEQMKNQYIKSIKAH